MVAVFEEERDGGSVAADVASLFLSDFFGDSRMTLIFKHFISGGSLIERYLGLEFERCTKKYVRYTLRQ